MGLIDLLQNKVPMKLDGFETLWSGNKTYNPEEFFHLSFTEKSFQEQYDSFKERIFSSIGVKYLPIYRMADGEFKFCLDFLDSKNPATLKKKLRLLKRLMSSENMYGRKLDVPKFDILKNIFSLRSIMVAHGENYTLREKVSIKKKYIDNLTTIANNGILAVHFMEELNSDGYVKFIKPMCRWFEKNGIIINNSNYVSFYNVYALLSGYDSVNLFNKRKILIISSDHDGKFMKLNLALTKLGASSVKFYNISPTKSLLEIIDLNLIHHPIDLVLIGAGIGTSNILTQLNKVDTVCIDAGIFLEVLINPYLNSSRFFLKLHN